jgi:hypothetical protein
MQAREIMRKQQAGAEYRLLMKKHANSTNKQRAMHEVRASIWCISRCATYDCSTPADAGVAASTGAPPTLVVMERIAA